MPKPFALIALVSSLLAAGSSAADDAYLLTSFRESGDGLHLAYSFDGRDWTDLDTVYLEPSVGSGLMRDPHIEQGPDGRYHMVWTSGWRDLGIGYASSSDLQTWSEQRFLPLMEGFDGAQLCWAPELFFDQESGRFLIVWSTAVESDGSTARQFRAYYSLTSDFESFTEPKLFFDPGFNNIDTTLLRQGNDFYAILKETDNAEADFFGAIHVARSGSLLGPYELLDIPVLQDERAEGPAVVDTGDEVIVYFDYYTEHRYGARTTTDWENWKDISKVVAVPEGQRHGSIFRAPESLVETLRAEAASVAPPPILQGEFTADPAIRVFGDRYYIYPTSDRPYWNTTEFAVWSSPDLVNWRKDGIILDITEDVSWANNKA